MTIKQLHKAALTAKLMFFSETTKKRKANKRKPLRALQTELIQIKDTSIKLMSFIFEVPSRVELLYTVLQTVT